MQVEIRFPCGYRFFFKEGLLDLFGIRNVTIPEDCPIHGKKCAEKIGSGGKGK